MSAWVGSAPWVGSDPWVHATPPSVARWFTPSDCGCSQCDFLAGFYYNDTIAEFDITCRLVFLVHRVTSGCSLINVEDADITVSITGPGGAEGPVTTITGDVPYTGGYLWWEKWKPVAGSVYEATVTLTCGYETTTREYTFTVPNPANTDCDCCDVRIPDYAVISGMTGDCCEVLNGTYALSYYSTCLTESDLISVGSDPGACDAETACYTCTRPNGDIFYFYPKDVRVTVGIGIDPITLLPLPSADDIRVAISLTFWVYRKTFFFEVCTQTQIGSCFPGLSRWIFNSECTADNFELVSSESDLCALITPTLNVVFE